MIKFRFAPLPRFTKLCYLIGCLLVAVTVSQQVWQLSFFSAKLNLQLFILGAIIVAIGSSVSWFVTIKNRSR